MLHCWLKILYYIVLILYHCVDVVFDWIEFGSEDVKFAGVPTNSTAVKVFLGISCGIGTFCTLAMMTVYGYYIKYHCECIDHDADYQPVENVRYQKNSLLEFSSNNNIAKPCNRHFVLAELLISNIELYLKDGVQSTLLLYVARTNNTFSIRTDWPDIVFAVCSVVASFKILICFVTKVFGFGIGEKAPEDCERYKFWGCIFGCLGCLVSAGFAVAYLVVALHS